MHVSRYTSLMVPMHSARGNFFEQGRFVRENKGETRIPRCATGLRPVRIRHALATHESASPLGYWSTSPR